MRRVGFAAASVFLLAGLIHSHPAHAIEKPGESCNKVGRVITIEKTSAKLLCVNAYGSKYWIRVPTASSIDEAQKISAKFNDSISIPSIDLMQYFLDTSGAYVSERLSVAESSFGSLQTGIAGLRARINALETEISTLPTQISDAKQASDAAESKLAAPLQELNAAKAEFEIARAEYSRVSRESAAYTACKITEMFGFGGPCGTFNQSYLSLVDSRFSRAASKADAANAKYQGFYSDYKAKNDAYRNLYGRQTQAGNELAGAKAELAQNESALVAAEAHLDASRNVARNIEQLRVAVSSFQSANEVRNKLAQKKLGTDWKKDFEKRARNWSLLQFHRSQAVNLFTEFRSMTPDLPDPTPETPSPTPSE